MILLQNFNFNHSVNQLSEEIFFPGIRTLRLRRAYLQRSIRFVLQCVFLANDTSGYGYFAAFL